LQLNGRVSVKTRGLQALVYVPARAPGCVTGSITHSVGLDDPTMEGGDMGYVPSSFHEGRNRL